MLRTLLRTKLARPRIGHDIVHRLRLRQRIENGIDGDLTLVTAPAGYGKTTVVADWARSTSARVAWVTLDEHDKDLVALLAYIIAAVRTLYPGACSELDGVLGRPNLPEPEWLAMLFCSEIDDLPERFVLVLDDFHLVTDPAVHQFFAALLRRPPLQMHLLITSRVEPSFQLSRLRANRRLNELRTEDLRFSREEAGKLLAALGAGEAASTIADSLLERMEGWAAGLHLAALTSMTEANKRQTAMDKQGAGNSHITSYLVEQVLQQQSPAVQRFLLKTSILDRISPALAAAVIGSAEEAGAVSFAALQHAGVFLTALDDKDEWYVYHSLFREVLQQQLRATLSPIDIAELHRRASRWFVQQGSFDEALRHAFAAGDVALASRIVIDNFPTWLESEGWRAINSRIELFPAATIEQNPWLLVAKAHMLHLQYKWDALQPLLHKAESRLAVQDAGLSAAAEQLAHAYLDVLWAAHWSLQTDAPRVKAAAHRALENLPEEHLYVRGISLLLLTIAQQACGESDAAEKLLKAALASAATATVGERAMLRPLMCLTSLYLADGYVAQATQMGQTLLQKAVELQSPANQMWAHLALGAAAYELNELETAVQHYGRVLDLRQTVHARVVHESLIGLALAQHALGRREAVQGALAALADLHQEVISPALTAEAVSLRRRLTVLNGEIDPGQVRESGIPAKTSIWYGWFEIPAMTAIQAALAKREPVDWTPSEAALEQLLLTAAQLHKPGYLVRLMALKALLHRRRNDEVTALHVLRRALAIGESHGLVRSVVDAGPQLVPLLAAIAAETPSAYVQQLCAILTGPAPAGPQQPGPVSPQQAGLMTAARQGLPHPLTRREREVLALLGQHRTDREIADALVISPLTVRTHIENLASKLSVNGRRAIVSRAREHGLLS
jgi:LuxR family maltose regulon positive regulatory protein